MEKQPEQQELKDIIASREDGFGYQFKTARAAKNVTIDEVARELHLDKKIIVALESEDHTQLPVSAFVCGYIRNYAKFLNIQPEPLIEYYKKERNDVSLEPQLKISKEKNIQGRKIISAILMPVILLSVLVALAAGGWELWIYVSSHYLVNDNQQEEVILPAADMTMDDLHNSESGNLLLPERDSSYDLPAGEEMIEQGSTISAEQTVEPSISTDNNTLPEENIQQTEEAISDEAVPAEDASAANNEARSVVDAPDEMPKVSVISDESASSEFEANQLIMVFSGNSWVSIKDSDNKILSSGLIKSGKTLRLDGKLPYNVFLGDARMVTISINGHVFDHSSYINDKNIARFKVK